MNKKNIEVHISKWHTKWIIGGIFREAAEACSIQLSWQVYPTSKKDLVIPKVWLTKLYPQFGVLNIYAHQDTFFSIHAANREEVQRNRNRVFLTHLNEGQLLSEEQIGALRCCERILVQNESMENYLVSQGILKNEIVRAPGAVNREVYKPSDKPPKSGYVLFSGDFKYRKNPELIAAVVTAMPDINFVVHGKNWGVFPKNFLFGLPNLKRINFDLKNQPQLMRQASLYVSLALIEGGPYPVLEALASGTPVVATDTGFCSEFINLGNGMLLPRAPELDVVTAAIRQSLSLKRNVWGQDLLFGKWQWKNLGELIFN